MIFHDRKDGCYDFDEKRNSNPVLNSHQFLERIEKVYSGENHMRWYEIEHRRRSDEKNECNDFNDQVK